MRGTNDLGFPRCMGPYLPLSSLSLALSLFSSLLVVLRSLATYSL